MKKALCPGCGIIIVFRKKIPEKCPYCGHIEKETKTRGRGLRG